MFNVQKVANLPFCQISRLVDASKNVSMSYLILELIEWCNMSMSNLILELKEWCNMSMFKLVLELKEWFDIRVS
jgi:hypothetical protein